VTDHLGRYISVFTFSPHYGRFALAGVTISVCGGSPYKSQAMIPNFLWSTITFMAVY
jgi:hypothetical protein